MPHGYGMEVSIKRSLGENEYADIRVYSRESIEKGSHEWFVLDNLGLEEDLSLGLNIWSETFYVESYDSYDDFDRAVASRVKNIILEFPNITLKLW